MGDLLPLVLLGGSALIAATLAAVLTLRVVGSGLALGPLMVLGSFLGKRLLERLPESVFIWLIEGVLLVSGVSLRWGGCEVRLPGCLRWAP